MNSIATLLLSFLNITMSPKSDCDMSKIQVPTGSEVEITQAYQQSFQEGKKCEAIAALISLSQKNKIQFVNIQGFPRLLALMNDQRMFVEAKELIQRVSYAHVFNQDRAEFEYQMWRTYSNLISENTHTCTENPITRNCDEGVGLAEAAIQYLNKFPESNRHQEMKGIAERFYQFSFAHENNKLVEFIAQYETAVHPRSVVSKLVNRIKGNTSRTDGKVLANCVGGHEGSGLSGKCDLLDKHALVSRILNQAFFMESFLKDQDKANIRETIVKYLTELKVMVEQNPQIKADLYSTFQEMNFDQVISEYQMLK